MQVAYLIVSRDKPSVGLDLIFRIERRNSSVRFRCRSVHHRLIRGSRLFQNDLGRYALDDKFDVESIMRRANSRDARLNHLQLVQMRLAELGRELAQNETLERDAYLVANALKGRRNPLHIYLGGIMRECPQKHGRATHRDRHREENTDANNRQAPPDASSSGPRPTIDVHVVIVGKHHAVVDCVCHSVKIVSSSMREREMQSGGPLHIPTVCG